MKKYWFVVVVVLLAVLALTVMAQDDNGLSEQQQHNTDIAQEVVETFWNSTSTEDELLELEARAFAETYLVHSFFADMEFELTNGSSTRNAISSNFVRLEDMTATVEDVFVAEDAVTVIARIEATPMGWALRNGFFLPRSDDPVTWEYVSIFRFGEDGLINEWWNYVDMPDVEKLD